MRSLKTPKLLIVEAYSNLINEFMGLLNQSEIMREMNYPISSICIGINAIHRVFEIILFKTKTIEKTYYYSQRAYYYYLEYIEQIYRANLFQNLNHMDIILFVYKKTIFDIYDGEQNDNSQTISNIMTLNSDQILCFDEKEWRILLLKMTKMTNILFHWENTNINFRDRHHIASTYLFKFLTKIDIFDNTVRYLELTQEKMEMNSAIYESLLKELLKKIEFKRTKLETVNNDFLLTKFYIEEHIGREKFDSGDMKEFVRWLYSRELFSNTIP